MNSHRSSSRISKIRILPARVQKKQFNMPLSNRYFSKISIQNSIMGLSVDHSREKIDSSEKKTQIIGRSFSINVNRKQSFVKNKIHSTFFKNDLPQIKTKRQKQKSKAQIKLSQIISSEVGALSFNMIMDLKQKIEERSDDISKTSTIKANSIASEEYSLQEYQEQNKQITKVSEQRPYQEYDKLLMMKQPVVYMRKRFNLKHKAQWVIPS